MTRSRAAWTWFALGAAVLLAALAWLTATTLALEHEAGRHEKLRLGLWRMDSWLLPQLAREAARPAAEYRAYAPLSTAWTKGYEQIRPNEVLTPSPLLTFRSELFVLHFEVDANGRITSPQVPEGNERDLAEGGGVPQSDILGCSAQLDQLRPRLLQTCKQAGLQDALQQFAGQWKQERQTAQAAPMPQQAAQVLQTEQEFQSRKLATDIGRNLGQTLEPSSPDIGALTPVWLPGEPAMLAYIRKVDAGKASRTQGFVADWQALQRGLLAAATGLFPPQAATLVPCPFPDPATQGRMLASVPARLDLELPAPAGTGGPARKVLFAAWSAALLTLLAVGWTLHRTIAYGERRARFASAVTHELRTPLTTFRMYSEMLADGVVRETAQRQVYLDTLKTEADRLARVVENVLCYARLEEGRFASRRDAVRVADLLSRALPPLQRRAQEAGLELQVDGAAAADTIVATDEDAVGQILFNLVDNACKYARPSDPARLEISAGLTGPALALRVRDHGPGIDPAHARRVFQPFDRGRFTAGVNEPPGIGLGLALSRSLARDLGGELLLAESERGACFVLTLPVGQRG
jgi:signal transduction histidine kinase